jgi:hypothetical protein
MDTKAEKLTIQFWALSAFLVLVFVMGGSSRDDVQSLLILRPISILTCALAIASLQRRHVESQKWLFGGFIVVMALPALQLIPLPLGLVQNISDRQLTDDVAAMTNTSGLWQPLTIAPAVNWNALGSLPTPLAVLLLGSQLSKHELHKLLPILIGLGALSGLFGLIQASGSPEGPLYFYRLTNNGSAVGLFANRNHAATLLACLFPMLAAYAAVRTGNIVQQRRRRIGAVAMAIILIPLILVTGSRSGLFVSLIGLAGAALVYWRFSADAQIRPGNFGTKALITPVIVGIMFFGVALVTLFFSRAEAIQRLLIGASDIDSRGDFWAVAIELVAKYSPSGSGSFVHAFAIGEPISQLDSSYLNRAHNDFIEVAVVFGLPGVALLAIAALFYARRTFDLWHSGERGSRSVMTACMAGIVFAILGMASLTDYPLRAPAMMCVCAVMSLWLNDVRIKRLSA